YKRKSGLPNRGANSSNAWSKAMLKYAAPAPEFKSNQVSAVDFNSPVGLLCQTPSLKRRSLARPEKAFWLVNFYRERTGRSLNRGPGSSHGIRGFQHPRPGQRYAAGAPDGAEG